MGSTKHRSGRWTVEEHQLFLQGIQYYGRDWRRVQDVVKSRSIAQVRTHAQKIFSREKYKARIRGRYASRLKDIEDTVWLSKKAREVLQQEKPKEKKDLPSYYDLTGARPLALHEAQVSKEKRENEIPPHVFDSIPLGSVDQQQGWEDFDAVFETRSTPDIMTQLLATPRSLHSPFTSSTPFTYQPTSPAMKTIDSPVLEVKRSNPRSIEYLLS